jgi:hypothetical protein
LAYAEETCPTTQKKHYQAFAYAHDKMKLSGWKKLFPTAHIEEMRGSFTENEKYCSKEGMLTEQGVRPSQGQRNDLLAVKKLIDSGKRPMEIADGTAGKRKSYVKTKRPAMKSVTIKKAVKQAMDMHVETKTSCQSSNDGVEIFHNNFITRSTNLLSTSQGSEDPAAGVIRNRIGDQIFLKGISIKMMLELNERYSMATFKIFVVKASRGDTPTKLTLFNNLSGNKMIDTINTERYSILLSKTVVIRQSSQGIKASGIQEVGSGRLMVSVPTAKPEPLQDA